MPEPTLLLTRPDAACRQFLQDLEAEGIRPESVIISPLIEITFEGALPPMADITGLIFTSAAGVEAYRAAGGPHRETCFTVGDATADAARSAGLHPVSAQGDAAALIAMILEAAPSGPLLHPHGRHTRGDIAKRLVCAGIETHSAVLYDQPLHPLSAEATRRLATTDPVVAPLFSPRSAAAFAKHGPFAAPLYLASMSDAVAEPLRALLPEKLVVAAQPNGTALRSCVVELWSQAQSLEGREADQ